MYICARLKADLVAQLVEHLPFKERVQGSSPCQITKTGLSARFFFLQQNTTRRFLLYLISYFYLMKFSPLIIFSVFILLGCNTKQKVNSSQKIQWLSIEEVQEKMKSNPKKVLIDIYTDWCGPCKRMSKYTFTNPEVIRIITEEFYAVKFNAESREEVTFFKNKYINKGRTHDFAIQVGSTASGLSYPTIIYFNESFKKIQAVPGFYEPQEFTLVLKYFGGNNYKNMSYDTYYKSQR